MTVHVITLSNQIQLVLIEREHALLLGALDKEQFADPDDTADELEAQIWHLAELSLRGITVSHNSNQGLEETVEELKPSDEVRIY
jgi:hypothetical protein